MTSNYEPESRDPEEKEEKSQESLVDDEENALPSEQQKETGNSSPAEEQKPTPPQSNDPGPVPNGGFQAWLQVVGAFMLFFNTFGILK